MTIRRGRAAGDKVTVLRRALMQDKALTYRARGVAGYVLSRPPNWRTTAVQLAHDCPSGEGEKAVRTALRELEDRGYLIRRRRQLAAGGETIAGRKLRGGAWITEWELTDDPATLVESGATERPKRPLGQRPSGGRAAPEGTAAPPPSVVDRETGTRDTTPNPRGTVADDLAAAVVVVVEEAGVKPPGLGVLTDACAKLRAYGWDVPTIERAAREHDWHGARAGAVVAWARALRQPPPLPGAGTTARAPHCGVCDPGTRLLVDDRGRPRRGHPCPTCGDTPTEAKF